jgi:GT2 family glycosyltransferase
VVGERVSAVIPTWNGRDLLVRCLESLHAQSRSVDDIIVVDDGSTDGTKEMLNEHWPDVRIISMPVNGGFAKAMNAGLRAATGQWTLVLNNDVTLEPDCLQTMLVQGQIGNAQLFSPLVYFDGKRDRVFCAGDLMRVSGRPESIGYRVESETFIPVKSVFGVSFCAALIRRDVFQRAGMLDERFVAYFEDADFCFRARLAGFRAECVPEAKAYHVGSASIAGRLWWRARQCFVNHGLMIMKNMPARVIAWHAFAISIEHLHQMRSLFSAARAANGSFFALRCLAGAMLFLFASIPHALKRRLHIQRVRILTSKQLDSLLTR